MVEPSLESALRNGATFFAMLNTLDRDLPVDITFMIDLYQARAGKKGLAADRVFRQPGGRGAGGPLLPFFPGSVSCQPPAPARLGPSLFALEKFLRRKAPYPGLVMGGLAFYQLHLLRPFVRHNVELAGIVLATLFFRDGAVPFPSFTLSSAILADPERFEVAFTASRDNAAPDLWLAFVLDGVITQAEQTDRLIRSLLQVREEHVDDLIATFGPSGGEGLARLAGELLTEPVLTVGLASKLLRVTFRSAQLAIDKMVDVGVLEEVTGRKRNRLYLARRVIGALEEELPKE
ncbi:MAG: hypothetical protein HQK87_03460 [Nitrospinae bacterium]|nr:hypothetical protein [Nitrospinota bacterium]